MDLQPRTAAEQAAEQTARMVYLEKLYALDGRDDPNHPLRGTYTGLFAKYGPNHKPNAQ